ncbi:hypothetical protein WA026_019998 [Henosepilachna vigintioctopunctata]|uniref:Uncharacterized protein n=1 Tax=Henosepilachna vigintioctopunctata TaxID=420089 RepID=A0AAW1UW51_9CUCU
MRTCEKFSSAARLYWRALFSIIWPLTLLSIIIIDDSRPSKCLFVVLLMIGYWITETLNIIITSFLPIVLFPVLDVMSTEQICSSYMDGANMMFLVGVILASAVKYSRLHERIALTLITFIGCSPKKLHLGIVVISAVTSMWISNTATTNVMIPIVSSILTEFESRGLVTLFHPDSDQSSSQPYSRDMRKPTAATMCYYISVAYASIIGSMGTLIGTEVNISFKGVFESTFKDAPPINFGYFMLATIPIVILILIFSTLMLQIWFLGLFRPNSKEAQLFAVGEEVVAVAQAIIDSKRKKLGSITFHEIAVSFCYLLAIFLWIVKSTNRVSGWIKSIKVRLDDSTIGVVVVILMFCIPVKPNSISTDRERNKSKQVIVHGLTTWKFIRNNVPWGVVLLIGSGVALAKAIKISTMDDYILNLIGDLKYTNPYLVLTSSCIAVGCLTQFSTNVVVANISLPLMAELAQDLNMNPLFLMYPVTLSCSFTFMFPVSAAPNSVAALTCNMPTKEMIKIGIILLIISLMILLVVTAVIFSVIFDSNVLPHWARTYT